MDSEQHKNLSTEKYHLFLTDEFSQWYPSDFTSKEGLQFSCAEQYMMYNKAMLFGDKQTADQVLKATTPKEFKELGRQVKGFDQEVWEAHACEIVYQGNYYKFTQNPYLYEALTATAGKEIAEAADYDQVWGIGLRADDPLARDKANWKGKNWLGGTLTKLRDDLAAQGFKPTYTADNSPMIKFYDHKGQRTLYALAKDVFHTTQFADEIKHLQSNMDYLNGDYYDDRRDPVMVGMNIKGHGYVENRIDEFCQLNAKFLRDYSSSHKKFRCSPAVVAI